MKLYPIPSFTAVIALPLITLLSLTGCDTHHSTNLPSPATSATASTPSANTLSSTPAISASTPTIISESAVTATAILPAPLPSLPASTPASSPNPTVKADKSAKSLITQPTAPNTPEDVLKKAMDALMAGNAKEASSYYHIEGIDMAQMLTQQVPVVQKQLKHLDISPTQYNEDNTKAGIIGKLTLTNSKQPKQTLYKFEKINGEWKIVE